MAPASADTSPDHGKSLQDLRHESATSMESFIKHHMMVILQPFINHVQTLDARLSELAEQHEQTEGRLQEAGSMIEATKAAVAELRDGVIDRTSTRVQKLNDAIERCVQNHELLHQGHEETKGNLQQIQGKLQSTSGRQPEFQRSILQLETDVQEIHASIKRMSDAMDKGINSSLDRMGHDLQDLKVKEGSTSTDVQQLKAEMALKGQLLQDAREALERTNAGAASLQRQFQDMSQREAQMGARVEGWKHQWSKLNPAIDALRKEAAHLKQRSEQHDVAVQGLQQGYVMTFSSVEALDGKHHTLRSDVQALQDSHAATQKSLAETRDGLGQATAFANSLHTALDRTTADLGRASQKLDGLETRHNALTDSVEKTSGNLAGLARDHRTAAAHLQSLQQDMQKTNEHLTNTRSQLEATSSNLQSISGELGRTNETVQRLDHGVELCHAGFTGLQKGFADTGTHISTRPITLPKLPGGGSSLRSPRPPDAGLGMVAASAAGNSWRSS